MKHFSERLQILFLPYVLVTLLLGVGYTFLNWFFCINTQWVAINEMYIDFIIPMVITILLVYFVIRPRLHILQLAPGKDTFGIQMLIAISMFIPTAIAQNYIDWNGVPYCPISEENHKKYVLSEGDVVVARTGATVGYAKMVGRNIPDSVFASFLVRIRPIDDEYRYYFGLAITSAEFLNFVQTNAGGSAQPQANPPLLGEFELSIPNKQSLPEFNTKISSFLGVIESNETEISKLHEVKDTMVKMLSSR